MPTDMTYRHLGRSGLQVSQLSFGSWVTFKSQVDVDRAAEMLSVARDAGVNFFDNAESYAGGESERIMGAALASLGWPRWSYVVSTKLFWGIHDAPVNMRNTLNRKYLLQAIDGSLERFGLDFVDLLYCHRSDPSTPMEELVLTMSEIVSSGRALYWGTSEWSAPEISAAWAVADRYGLHRPIVEQPQYNLFSRSKVEEEYLSAGLYDEPVAMGLTTWSPLASGLLTGKYAGGSVPEGSRAALEGYGWLKDRVTSASANAVVSSLSGVASSIGCSVGQLAIAWCARNPHVSSVILGASQVSQLQENLAALEVVERLDDDVLARIDAVVATLGT